MEQKILDFAEEKFRYKYPGVQFYPERLMINTGTGAQFSGSFKVLLGEGRHRSDEKIRGYFTCLDHRMKIEPLTFSSAEEVIHFTYDTTYLQVGEKIEKKLYLISSHGEYELPYSVEIIEEKISCPDGDIVTLEEFANLASSDFAFAKEIFCSKKFEERLLKGKEKERLIRKALLFSSDSAHALEEFLFFIGAKERVVISTDITDLEYQLLGKKMKYTIPLKRNTWGYFRADLTLVNNTINLSKKVITNKDFVGDNFDLEIEVNPEVVAENGLKDSLMITGIHNQLELSIRIISPDEAKLVFIKGNKNPASLIRAIKTFYDYRMKKVSKQELSLALRTALRGRDEKILRDESPYFNAYADYLIGKTEEVKIFLSENERWEKTPLAATLHHYLKYCLAEEPEQQKIKRKIEELADRFGVMEAYLFIMQIEERFRNNNANKLELLRRLYKAGMNRIFLYLETWLVLNESPELFKKLDSFIERTFVKAFRYGFPISKDLAARFVSAAIELKEYSPLSLSVLKQIYEKDKSEEIVTAIIHQLLKSENYYSDTEKIIKDGIQRGIKLTGIYELYAKNLKEGDEIEQSAFTYFLFGEGPNSAAKLLMFSYLVKKKKFPDFMGFYEKYEEKIRKFALESLKQGMVSENYLVIYKDMMQDRSFVKEAGRSLSNLVYKNLIRINDGHFRELIVLHKGLKKPKSFKINNETCYVDRLREDSVFLLMDNDRRLFIPEEKLIAEELFRYEGYTNELFQDKDENILTALAIFREGEEGHKEAFFEACKRLEVSDLADEDLKRLAKKGLICYYETQSDIMRLETAIENIDLAEYDKKDGKRLADIILRNQIKGHIFEAVKYYGAKFLPISTLQKFVEEGIRVEKVENEALVIEAAMVLVKAEKGNKELYHWLSHKLEAPVRVLFDLLKRMMEEDVLTVSFKNKVFEQILFTEVLPEELNENFVHLSLQEGDDLTKAYLNYRYYRWLLNDSPLGSFVEKRLEGEVLRTKSLLPIISYLKFLSRKETLETEEKEFVAVRLLRLTEEGIVLPFFKDFSGKCKVPAELENICFAYCHADNEDEISIHYKFSLEGQEEIGSMVDEWMKNVYLGIFVKQFLLFADEKVKYYITYKEEEEIKSGELKIELETLLSEDGRRSLYAEMNQIYLARILDDKKALYENMQNYMIQREVLKDIFTFQLPNGDGR